jgi:hypothetical protein
MTVSSTSPQVTYIGNGATTVFSWAWQGTSSSSQIRVTLVEIATLEETNLTEGVDYSVDLGASEITYPLSGSPMSSSFMLKIRRELVVNQGTSFSSQGNFDPTSLEDALDYVTMLVQQVLNLVRNQSIAIKMPVYTVATLPSVTSSAPGIIYVNDAAGGGIPCFSDGTNWRRVDNREVVS